MLNAQQKAKKAERGLQRETTKVQKEAAKVQREATKMQKVAATADKAANKGKMADTWKKSLKTAKEKKADENIEVTTTCKNTVSKQPQQDPLPMQKRVTQSSKNTHEDTSLPPFFNSAEDVTIPCQPILTDRLPAESMKHLRVRPRAVFANIMRCQNVGLVAERQT